jgi:aryl-alcohol dehydrogenase-like predicted oxidoreductase
VLSTHWCTRGKSATLGAPTGRHGRWPKPQLRNQARFDSLHAYYSIASHDLEREIVPLLESEKVGLLVWIPLAGGLLSGKFSRTN